LSPKNKLFKFAEWCHDWSKKPSTFAVQAVGHRFPVTDQQVTAAVLVVVAEQLHHQYRLVAADVAFPPRRHVVASNADVEPVKLRLDCLDLQFD
jgi:hypothetical protein